MVPDTPICLFFVQLHNACACICYQLLLWLTLNFPNLCISVYILRIPPRMAPARTRTYLRTCVCTWLCGRTLCASCVCASTLRVACKLNSSISASFQVIDNCYGISCHCIRLMWWARLAGWCKYCSADAYNLLPNTIPPIRVVAVLPRSLQLPRTSARVLRTNCGIEDTCSGAWNGVGRGWCARQQPKLISIFLRFYGI